MRLVHRLDKDTSGVLLLAKNRAAQRELTRQFMSRTIEKEYLALVAGEPTEDKGEIDQPLARHPSTKQIAVAAKRGQAAVTQWEVVRRFNGMTLLKCRPLTGRMHQIRVHLKTIGLPLAVDPVYNPPPRGQEAGIFLSQFKRNFKRKEGEPERPLIARLSLHAERIEFTNLKGRRISVSCPPARDFSTTINQLTKNASRSAGSGPEGPGRRGP
jgi:RluA family pseudouridine synthase